MGITERAELILKIFAPDKESYGSYPQKLTPSEKTPGKIENPKKGLTLKRRWPISLIENHLRGEGDRFGCVPISSGTNTVRFMACDVDIYDGSIDLPSVAVRLFEIHPMLFLFRSKSGAPHIYAFFRDDVSAGAIKQKMREIVTSFGWGASFEYFPKQDKIDIANDEFGNWINLPYYACENPIQYAFDATGISLTIDEFLGEVQTRAGTLSEFLAIQLAGHDIITDGPPCLQRVFGDRIEHNRNIMLRNLTVYLKKKYPEEWFKHLETFNRRYTNPLPASEMQALMKSCGTKEYGYGCSDQPMAGFCNRSLCNTRKYGVCSGAAFPYVESLTKHCSEPPVWWVYFDTGKKIRCTTEDLQNPRAFQRSCMEQLNTVPPILKQDAWTRMLQELMKKLTFIEVPESATEFGIMKQYVIDYLTTNPCGDTFEELLNRRPVLVKNEYCFLLASLVEWLSRKSFGLANASFISLVLEQMGAKHRIQKINDTTRSIYILDKLVVKGHTEELTVPDMGSPAAY